MRPFASRLQKPKPKRLGRPAGRFTQHRRLDKLREALEGAAHGLTLAELAHSLHVTQRSVRRYLDELERAMEIESVETVPGGAHLWRIKPSERGRAVALRRSQGYGLLATRRIFEVMRGSALFDELDVAFAQIQRVAERPTRAAMKGEISPRGRFEERFLFLGEPPVNHGGRAEELDVMYQAVAELRVVRFRPRARLAESRGERVAFHPYAMVVHRNVVMFVGFAPASGEVDVLAFDQMSEIRMAESETFEIAEGFQLSHYLHGEFGVARPSRVRVLIEFDARVAEEVRARKVHPAQKLGTSPDGRVRLSMPLVNVPATIAWVLSFGDAARIVEPVELTRDVAERLERMRERYR